MKKIMDTLFGTRRTSEGEIHDESIERLADILVANYEARQRLSQNRESLQN